MHDGKPICIPNDLGDTLTPSVVAFQPGGSSLVGRAAKQQDPRTTYYSVKRLIGRTWSDPAVQEERGRLAYEVDQDSEGNAVLVCSHVEPGCLYPEEVSTCVLAQLLADAARHTGRQVSKAVITVPAYFSDEQRQATVAAGTLAGLDTVRLIREPVAAALAYGLDLTEEQVVLVFDLGGGTFDVSLLEVGNGTIEVLSTGGDAHLGGDDWDAAIVDWLRENFLDPAGVDSSSPAVAGRLKALAEYAKVQLSEHEQVTLRMPLGGPGGLQATLDLATFDSLSADLFRRARLPLDQACWAAGVDLNELQMGFAAKKEEMARKGVAKWKQDMLKLEIRPRARAAVSKVLLVGGATRMPAVRRFIANMTGLAPTGIGGGVDPDEAVALGAAVQAGILQGEVDSLMVMDQWQASLMRALAQLQLKSSPEARAAVAAKFDMDDSSEEGQAAEGQQQQQQQQRPPGMLDAEHVDEMAGEVLDGMREQQARGAGHSKSCCSSRDASEGSQPGTYKSKGPTQLSFEQVYMSVTNNVLAGPCGLVPAAATAQQGMSPFALEAGSISPPASSCSTSTALGAVSGSRSTGATPATSHSDGIAAGQLHQHQHHANCNHQRPQQQQQQQGVASMMAGHTAAGHAAAASFCPSREWLYRLVTFPAYFTPCVNCTSGCRTPKREQLMTLFDTKFPYKVFCSHCPECMGSASLLQVRRASFKDVVKATDIARFGADIGGVQQYTLNGSKVIYLNREAALEKKPNNNGSTAPAMCTVDGRAMMDKSSLYCSLKCKMQAEDAGFTGWLDSQDPAVRIMADIAANAPPRPTVACKRGVAPTSSGSSGGSAATESNGSAGCSGARPRKQARTESGGTVGAAAGAPAGQGTGDESAAPAAAAARAAKQRASSAMQRAASAPQGTPAGLKPIKTSLAGSGTIRMKQQPKQQQQHQQALLLPSSMLGSSSAAAGRQCSAPSAFLEAAMAEPQLGGLSSAAAAAAAPRLLQIGGAAPGGVSCSSWLAGPTELDNALSSNGTLGSWEAWDSWQGGMPASPSFALGVHGVADAWEDGSLSPALLPVAPAAAAAAAAGLQEAGTAAAAAVGCFGGLGGGMEDWWMPGSPAAAFAAAGMPGF
ncbi:hypothetical protein OEZ86_012015 [Tetradesmus obliquus]|nr:hypothetical protein OEZ86_012015 [Tetradesmus obliquus]